MNNKTKAYAAVLVATLIWGINFHFVKIGTLTFSVVWFLALRFGIASITYGVQLTFLWVRGRDRVSEAKEKHDSPLKHPWCWVIAMAGAVIGFYYLQTTAISTHSTINTAFLTATAVLWVPIFSRLLDRTRPRVAIDTWCGIVLSICGLAFILGFHIGDAQSGDIYALLGAILLALDFAIAGYVGARLPSKSILGWTASYTLLAAVAFLAYAVISHPGDMYIAKPGIPVGAPPDILSPQWAIASIIVAGALATGVASYLANYANCVRENGRPVIDAVHRSIIENLDSPVALACGLLWFPWNVQATGNAYAGYALVIVAVIVSELGLLTRVLTRSTPLGA